MDVHMDFILKSILLFITQLSASQAGMLTPVEHVAIVLCECLPVEFVCLDDCCVLYGSGVRCTCVLLSLGGVLRVCLCGAEDFDECVLNQCRSLSDIFVRVPLKRWNTLFTDKDTC